MLRTACRSQRLRRGTPALAVEDDAFVNHVHADDLARIVVAALRRGRPNRSYNAVDDEPQRMGDYFDLVADGFGLAAAAAYPSRRSRAYAAAGALFVHEGIAASRECAHEAGAAHRAALSIGARRHRRRTRITPGQLICRIENSRNIVVPARGRDPGLDSCLRRNDEFVNHRTGRRGFHG